VLPRHAPSGFRVAAPVTVPDVGLREAIYHFDQSGFTRIDHVKLNFWPTDDCNHCTDDIET
jgi:hypothetical protein